MDFVFHVGGMPFNGETIKNGESLGGSETSGYYLAKELAKLGHTVKVFSNIPIEKNGLFDGVEYQPAGEPTEKMPLGSNFTTYAQSIPCDVLYIQRNPEAFKNKFKSKMNVWATHDLALRRSLPLINSQLWNIDFVTAVSEWHKKQLEEVYDIDGRFVATVPNGVDPSLYSSEIDLERKFNSKNILFTSRPERGLMPLVQPGGIMEKLWEEDKEIKLFVTFYTLMDGPLRDQYQFMLNRCQELPNVNLLSPMGKKDLATLEENCALYIYPTEFEDTSCITAMSGQQVKTPFVSLKTGALPETLEGGGNLFLDVKDGDFVSPFVSAILSYLGDKDQYFDLANSCYQNKYTWEKAAKQLEKECVDRFKEKTKDKHKLFKHLTDYSDVFEAKRIKNKSNIEEEYIKERFGFLESDKRYKEKYEGVYQDLIKNEDFQSLGNFEYHAKDPRLKPLWDDLSRLPEGSQVLDFGSSFGQQLTAFAKAFPFLNFTGIEISKEAREIGEKFISKAGLENVRYADESDLDEKFFDYSMCCEVLEHVIDYEDLIYRLECYMKDGAKMAYTVPTNTPETGQFQHVRHFEKHVVELIFRHRNGFTWSTYNYGNHESLYFSYLKDDQKIKPWPSDYKQLVQNPKQEVSVCIITENDAGGMSECLKSVSVFSSEIIVGIDSKGKEFDPVLTSVLEQYNAKYFDLGFSPSDENHGFAKARNEVIKRAKKDWVFWIDDDEFVVNPQNIFTFLRDNQYDAYGIAQSHFSTEPKGCIKTDFPNRLFRNNKGIKFFGYVHEHPEKEMNKGCGKCFIIPENIFQIVHFGYSTEAVRRERFNRNLPLIVKDREENPERDLGAFLWMRDLIHLNRFKLERGEPVDQNMISRSREVVNLFLKFVEKENVKIVVDSCQYFNEAVLMLTNKKPMEFRFSFDANYGNIGDNKQNKPNILELFCENEEQVKKITNAFIQSKLKYFDCKYL